MSEPTIVRIKKRENPYVQIDRTCLEDPRLSFKAKGILAYLLSKPDKWGINIQDLVKHARGDGPESVRSGLKELASFGYAELCRGGKDGGAFWKVFESPQPAKPKKEELPSTDEKADVAETPTSGKPGIRETRNPGFTPLSNNNVLVRNNSTVIPASLGSDFHRQFIDSWSKAFKEQFKEDYLFLGGRDGKVVKMLSSNGMSVENLILLAKKGWNSTDRFIRSRCQTIHGFADVRIQLKENMTDPSSVDDLKESYRRLGVAV